MSHSPENLNKIYKVYVNWQAEPNSVKQPKTVEEFCVQAQITQQDVSAFEDRETYLEDLDAASIKWGRKKLPELRGLIFDHVKVSQKPEHLLLYQKSLEPTHADKKKTEDDSSRTGLLKELHDESIQLNN